MPPRAFLLLAAAASAQDEFCGFTSSECMDNTVRLRCLEPGATIQRVTFASYGTPQTAGPCSSWSASPACDAPGALAVATSACVGFPACAIPTFGLLFNNNTDPCPEKCKTLALAAVCTSGGGDAGGGTSCAVNGTACPLPAWAPVYSLSGSTVCEPGGDMANGGYWLPTHPWGLVSLDWSVAQAIWNKDGPAKGTAEATLTENCARIKAAHPGTKCFMCVVRPRLLTTRFAPPHAQPPPPPPTPPPPATTTWSLLCSRLSPSAR